VLSRFRDLPEEGGKDRSAEHDHGSQPSDLLFAEWRLRERLRETGLTVPNQLNKPTQRPTMRWVFEIFMGVIQAVVTSGGMIIKVSVNLTGTQITILKLLGRGCENYYGMR